jgi:hypothetical protein
MRFIDSKISTKDSTEKKRHRIKKLLEFSTKVLAYDSHGKLIFGDILYDKSLGKNYFIREDKSNNEIKLSYIYLKQLFFAY